MTNPGDIVRVRARRGGRASVYEANAWCQSFTDGLLDGVGVMPNTVADLNILVGGTPTCPDVVLAKNPAGYRIALDIVGQQAIAITTPATGSRISSVVAYTDDLSLATAQSDVTGSPASCGLIVVNGTASSNPQPPSNADIRSAITADGAAGSQASYGIIANVTVAASTSTITNTLIDIQRASLASKVTSDNVDWATIPSHCKVGSGITMTTNSQTWDSYAVTEAGRYLAIFTACGNAGPNASTGVITIMKNASTSQQIVSTSKDAYNPITACAIIDCAKGDTLYAKASTTSGSWTPFSDWSFTVARVG